MRQLILIDENILPNRHVFGKDIDLKQYRKFLGSNLQDTFYDGSQGLYPNSFVAIAGAVEKNHHLYLHLPQYESYDPDHLRMLDYGLDPAQCRHYFNQRLINIIHQSNITCSQKIKKIQSNIYQFHSQIFIGKRGSGKSTALTNKAKWLLSQNITPIIVVSPYRNNRHQFERLDHEEKAQIIFSAPDRILAKKPQAQYILIDEAASIAPHQLITLLSEYPNYTIASTHDGYEGSANEFLIKTLKHSIFQSAEHIHFNNTYRFQNNDPLESKINQIFILDRDDPLPISLNHKIIIEKITNHDLINNEPLLKNVWQVLRQAHYRNQPEDLKRLLDIPFQHLYVARIGQFILGVLHIIEEQMMNDLTLSTAIMNQQRRPRGRILMQQLLIQTQDQSWAKDKIYRIQRIAVLEPYRRRHIASRLIEYAKKDVDSTIGAIFQHQDYLSHFWHQLGFQAINSISKTRLFVHHKV